MRWGQMIKYSVLTDYDPTGLNNYPTYFNVWSETILERFSSHGCFYQG